MTNKHTVQKLKRFWEYRHKWHLNTLLLVSQVVTNSSYPSISPYLFLSISLSPSPVSLLLSFSLYLSLLPLFPFILTFSHFLPLTPLYTIALHFSHGVRQGGHLLARGGSALGLLLIRAFRSLPRGRGFSALHNTIASLQFSHIWGILNQ